MSLKRKKKIVYDYNLIIGNIQDSGQEGLNYESICWICKEHKTIEHFTQFDKEAKNNPNAPQTCNDCRAERVIFSDKDKQLIKEGLEKRRKELSYYY